VLLRGFGLQLGLGGFDRGEQGGRALLEGVGVGVQCRTQLLALCVGRLFLSAQCLRPGVVDGADGLRELAGDAGKLGFHRAEQRVVQAARFGGDAGHGGRDDRLDRFGRRRRAVFEAGLERLVDGLREFGVQPLGFFVEALLANEQLFGKLAALFGHLAHHGVEFADQFGQRLCLRLQGLEGFLALVGERETTQYAGDPAVEQLADLQALALTERGDQAEHGGGGDAGDRSAESDAEALDRRGECRADGVQVGRAFQRQHGAVQGDDHAEEGAEHAEKDQQPDEVRRDPRTGQGDALAFDAQANGVLQRGWYLL